MMNNSTKAVRFFFLSLLAAVVIVSLLGNLSIALAVKPPNTGKPQNAGKSGSITVKLQDIDSGLTSPSGVYRWLDVADQAYSAEYRSNYNYTQATVQVAYYQTGNVLYGTLTGRNLKPNFTYQVKLVGDPETDPAANEMIGLSGRWWQEEWNGSEWVNGRNLNSKGDGSSPNPNDEEYFDNRDIPDETSPTGLHYRYTGYMVFDYFTTDSRGKVSLDFQVDSCYHVLFKTTQRTPTESDGPVKTTTFDPKINSTYDIDYGSSTVSIFGEWERLPVGGVFLTPGDYTCNIILTEESFHGSGGTYAGNWAAAMGGEVTFKIVSN